MSAAYSKLDRPVSMIVRKSEWPPNGALEFPLGHARGLSFFEKEFPMLSLIFNRRGVKGDLYSRVWLMLACCTMAVSAFGQVVADPPASTKDEKKTRAGTTPTSSKQEKEATVAKRGGHGRLRPFYDVSFHSVTDPSSVNL